MSGFFEWWSNRRRKTKLKKDFLVERDLIVFLDSYGELKEDYDIAMKMVDDHYLSLGLTLSDLERVRKDNPFVRLE